MESVIEFYRGAQAASDPFRVPPCFVLKISSGLYFVCFVYFVVLTPFNAYATNSNGLSNARFSKINGL